MPRPLDPDGHRAEDEPPKLRRDAQRSREAILAAARALFASSADVPMYEIAKRAGVGQATLYRHFPDRSALAATLATELLERLEAELQPSGGTAPAFEHVLRALVDSMVGTHGLIDVVREGSGAETSEVELRERLVVLLGTPLRAAQEAGEVRGAVEVEDLFLFMMMIEGILHELSERSDRSSATDRALTIVLDGMRAA